MDSPHKLLKLANACCQMIFKLQHQTFPQRIVPHLQPCMTRQLQWRRSMSSTATASPPKDKLYRQITVEVKGHDPAVLNSYQKFTTLAAEKLGVNLANVSEPPKVFTRRSLLKSVFIFKKHQHQYENVTLFREFEFKHLTESTALTFLEYIQRNLPEGMAMKVTKHELHSLPDHLKPPKQSQPSAPPLPSQ